MGNQKSSSTTTVTTTVTTTTTATTTAITTTATTATLTLPTIFICHGGGPFPIFSKDTNNRLLREHFRQVSSSIPKPKAILIVSAHWEEALPTVQTGENPNLFFDYGGFPPETYKYKYAAPGAIDIAERIQICFKERGIKYNTNSKRGYDHGMFVPLMLMYPDADIPCVQLSIINNLDPAAHIQLGHAIGALRKEGVLILGSGMTYHNMRTWSGEDVKKWSKTFDDWLFQSCVQLDQQKREMALKQWSSTKFARDCHPREEHFVPLLVCVGAAAPDAKGKRIYSGCLGDAQISSFQFG